MSGTPIYEQLYRDYVEAGKAWSGEVTPPATSQLTVDAHATPIPGDAWVYDPDDHLPLALAEWACPGD